MAEESYWRIGLVQFRSISFKNRSKIGLLVQFRSIFVQRRSKGLWSVDQTVSGRSTIAPLVGRP